MFREDSGGANGLFFDSEGNLLACEGTNARVVSIDSQGELTVLADEYEGKAFNEPNDLWVDAKGGIYFSDPVYFKDSPVQGGEHVYYLTLGGADGQTLFITAGTEVYSLEMRVKGVSSFGDEASEDMGKIISGLQIMAGREPALPLGKEADVERRRENRSRGCDSLAAEGRGPDIEVSRTVMCDIRKGACATPK